MRLKFKTPRERLVLTSTAMLVGGLLLLSAIALVTLNGVIRGALDTRLTITAEAIEALTDYGKHDLHLDAADIRQFNRTLALQVNGAVFGHSDKPLISSASSVPEQIVRLTARPGFADSFQTVGQGANQVRVYVRPVIHRNERFGTIVVWRADAWAPEIASAVLLTLAGAVFTIGLLGAIIIGRVSRHALDEALERQRRFTADASHELRTPLSVIRAEADLAMENGCTGSEYRDALSSIQRETGRMTDLIDDMLAIARAEANRGKQGTIDLPAVCEAVCRRLAPVGGERGIQLAYRADDAISVRGDETSLTCVVSALVQNAIKHAPNNGHVSVSLSAGAHHAELLVSDDGAGFSAAALARGFERFWRDGEVRTRGAGYGLGLAIAKSIVDSYDGRIELSNAPNGGAHVRCVIPLRTKHPPGSKRIAEAGISPNGRRARERAEPSRTEEAAR